MILLVLSHQLGKLTTRQEHCKKFKPLIQTRMFSLVEKPCIGFSRTRCFFVAKSFFSKVLAEVNYHDIWSYFP